MKTSRREFLKQSAKLSALGLLALPRISFASSAKVVIVGGGVAGCTLARYLKQINNSVDVTLVEKNPKYVSAFMNNQVLTGEWSTEKLTFTYENLAKLGVKIIQDAVSDLDVNQKTVKTVKTAAGKNLNYDKLILTTGIDASHQQLEGADEDTLHHNAWSTGTHINALFKKVQALKAGGEIVLTIPRGEISGLTAAYERASSLATFLKKHNPKASVLVVDGNKKTDLQNIFIQAWNELYPDIIKYHGDQNVIKQSKNTVSTKDNDYSADLLNVISPQRASKLAHSMGLVDESGWCPVNPANFESTKIANVHVIGDSMKSSKVFRKNAQTANGQAKVLALSLSQELSNSKKEFALPPIIDTEYVILSPNYAVSSSRLLRFNDNTWQVVSQGMSALNAPVKQRQREVQYAYSWFNNITHEIFES